MLDHRFNIIALFVFGRTECFILCVQRRQILSRYKFIFFFKFIVIYRKVIGILGGFFTPGRILCKGDLPGMGLLVATLDQRDSDFILYVL